MNSNNNQDITDIQYNDKHIDYSNMRNYLKNHGLPNYHYSRFETSGPTQEYVLNDIFRFIELYNKYPDIDYKIKNELAKKAINEYHDNNISSMITWDKYSFTKGIKHEIALKIENEFQNYVKK